MEYNIGDKVELTNDCIIVITDIKGSVSGERVLYSWNISSARRKNNKKNRRLKFVRNDNKL